MKSLLEGGADPKLKQGNRLPVQLALSGKKVHTARLILEWIEKQNGLTPEIVNRALFTACECAQKESFILISELIEQGADVNYKGPNDLTPLHNAAVSGNASAVELLLSEGADINAVSGGMETPLHLACNLQRVQTVRLLLENGASPNASAKGVTPLHLSVKDGREARSVIEMLLKAGADRELRTADGLTALDIATKYSLPEVADLLLEESDITKRSESLADIQLIRSIKDKDMKAIRTLLSRHEFSDEKLVKAAILAIDVRSDEIIAYLLKQGLKPDAKDSNGNPIIFAIIGERVEPGLLLRFLHAGLDPDIQDESGNSLLHLLSESSNYTYGYIFQHDRPRSYTSPQLVMVKKLIRTLLDKKVSADLKNKVGQTPLHLASQYADLETVKLLVDAGGTLEMLDSSGNSMIHYAARGKNQTEILKYLLEKGLSPSQKTDDGKDAMTLSSASGSSEVVELLFKTANEDYTPDPLSLINAITIGKEEIALRLIEHGCDPNATEDGRSALIYATEMGMFPVVEALLKAGADTEKGRYGRTCLHSAAGRGDVKMLRLLIDSGANIAAEDGLTVAMSAACAFSMEALKLLKAHGADLTAKTKDNYTPLMAAARAAFHVMETPSVTETVKYLVSEGVGVNDVDDYGNTALDYACGASNLSKTNEPPACVMFVKTLLACGADAGRSGKGSAAYNHARRLGFKTICQILLKTDKRD